MIRTILHLKDSHKIEDIPKNIEHCSVIETEETARYMYRLFPDRIEMYERNYKNNKDYGYNYIGFIKFYWEMKIEEDDPKFIKFAKK